MFTIEACMNGTALVLKELFVIHILNEENSHEFTIVCCNLNVKNRTVNCDIHMLFFTKTKI